MNKDTGKVYEAPAITPGEAASTPGEGIADRILSAVTGGNKVPYEVE